MSHVAEVARSSSSDASSIGGSVDDLATLAAELQALLAHEAER